MGHLNPLNEDGSKKDPATFSQGELRGISAEIFREQMYRHETGQHVDKGALEKAIKYSLRGEDQVMSDQCAALIAAAPITPPAPGSKPYGKAAP